jgi:hypothetical protein
VPEELKDPSASMFTVSVARACVAPAIGGDGVDGVGRFLRRIGQNISGQSETISLFAERPASSAITGAIGPDIFVSDKRPTE